MSFKKSFMNKSPLRQNGDEKLTEKQMRSDNFKANWANFKKYQDAYGKKKDVENYVKFRKSQYPQSGAIEITSGPETFFAAPGAKAGGFVLKKGADLIKSKVAKGAKNLGKNIGGAYAEKYAESYFGL